MSSSTQKQSASEKTAPAWYQQRIRLAARPRGCHVVTREIVEALGKNLREFEMGLANVFLLHTSASLQINENYSPDVPLDMESALNRIVPEKGVVYRHDDEGSDDMPAHVKTAIIGNSLTIPISKGRLALGTWQGLWLCEHRNHGGSRSVIVTLQGMRKC